MPEYSTPTLTPAETTKIPGMDGTSSGYILTSDLLDIIRATFGQANGVATLGSDGKLTSSQLPDLADDVIVVASYATLPNPGIAGKLYITADNNKMYRWDDALATPDYVELSVDLSAYATKASLLYGTLEPLISTKAKQDQNGNVIDTTYETKADANDLKNALDATNKRVENLEEKAGDYTEVDVKSVYSVPTGKASNMVLVGVEGVSRVNNQLVQNGDFSNGTTGWYGVASVTDGVGTKNFSSAYVGINRDDVDIRLGNVYLVSFKYKGDANTISGGWNTALGNINNSDFVDKSVPAPTTSFQTFYAVITFKSSIVGSLSAINKINLYNSNASAGNLWFTDIFVKNLNTYFNTTDLSFLGNTDSAKLAKIQSDYPWLLTPSSYGTSMVKTRYESFTSVGVNIWDEEYKTGLYLTTDGTYQDNSSRICTKNYIKVKPNTAYYINNAFAWVIYYDANKTFISAENQTAGSQSFTTPANCHYIMYDFASTYGTTYNHDIQICLNSYADKTTYHPYSKHTLSLPSPIELGSAGSVSEKAYLNEDGEAWKTNPINNNGVDLGTVHFTYAPVGTSGYFYSSSFDADMKRVATAQDKGNIICGGGYVLDTAYNVVYGSTSMVIGVNNSDSGKLILKNTAKTGADLDSQGKASWLNGVMFYYEKITPDADTPLTVLTDNWIATEGGGTLEAVKTYPIDDSFTVGYLTL